MAKYGQLVAVVVTMRRCLFKVNAEQPAMDGGITTSLTGDSYSKPGRRTNPFPVHQPTFRQFSHFS